MIQLLIKIFFFFLLISQQAKVNCEPNFEVFPSEEKAISLEKPSYYIFKITKDDIQKNEILHIKSTSEEFSSPGFLYASFQDNISEDNRNFSSQNLGKNNLYINLTQIGYYDDTLYLLVNGTNFPCKITLIAEYISKLSLSDENPKAKFIISHIPVLYYKIPETIRSPILLYSVGQDWDRFEMEVLYQFSNENTRALNVKQMIETGHGVIVDLNKIKNASQIIIKLKPVDDEDKRKVEVGFEYVDQDFYEYKREINLLEIVYGATETSRNCYQLPSPFNIKEKPVLLINVLTQAITLDIYDLNKTKLCSKNAFDNSYIRFDDSWEDMTYFCIKKYSPEENEYETLGESSYNFQLYYETELEKNQMFIMSLANGRIYTHSLNRDNVIVYRHDIYANYSAEFTNDKIYSANLYIIKGNPKLYGYECNTYPNCIVTKNTPNLEKIERINQYYVNKKKDAVGNVEPDVNGEFASEISTQYLSVVICETGELDPDNGICEYTIEINNQGEDTQLAPEKIMATTFLPGINYFSVKVSNHEEITNLNISLTVLTGDAYMKTYYDFDLIYEITNYKYHKVFRKEIFEFTSSDIKERYWCAVYCTVPSFIELTYSTDFHYKGYAKINPGEINIEYINKKDILYPYTIINPYYYSINTDNYFWFKIRTQECSMHYSYNNINESNVNTVNMISKSNQPNYTFLSTVDKYNYNSNDDLSDCSMIIYSGETNSEERPLLIISDYPIFSDLEENNYIYPFYNDENFKGIMIDIRFINNNNGKLKYDINLSINKTTIIAKNITKDEIIFINQSMTDLDCNNNLQCSLQIQINKNSNSDKTYNFTLNVYSPESTVPEIIDTTKNSNKIYMAKNGSKTVKIPIGKNQETEIKFSFSSGEGKVQAKLVPKNQFDDYRNYIFDDNDSSNMLNYDSRNRIIRITQAESDICEGGCELVMALKVDNSNEEFIQIDIAQSTLTEQKKQEENVKKIELWLTIVLIVVCVIVVAGVLILLYFCVLRKKNDNKIFTKYNEDSKKEIKEFKEFKELKELKETKNINDQVKSKEGEKIIRFNNN